MPFCIELEKRNFAKFELTLARQQDFIGNRRFGFEVEIDENTQKNEQKSLENQFVP